MASDDRVIVPEPDVPLAPLTTFGLGGRARWFIRLEEPGDPAAAVAWSVERGVPLFVLGGGSNVVVADEGFDGLVAQVALRGRWLTADGEDVLLTACAGEVWDDIVEWAVSRGLAGFECLSGIPGRVGGTPIQNVGAYGQEVSDTIEAVEAFDRFTAQQVVLSKAECDFAYRSSRFRRQDVGRFVVTAVRFRLQVRRPTVTYEDVVRQLEHGGQPFPSLTDVRRAVLTIRERKGMLSNPFDTDTHGVGSFFVNPVVPAAVYGRVAAVANGLQVPGFSLPNGRVKIPAAWLIEQSGVERGCTAGNVGISTKHALAIVNRGGATSRDVVTFAAEIKRRVADRFGVWLLPEPVFVGFLADEPLVRYLLDAGPPQEA